MIESVGALNGDLERGVSVGVKGETLLGHYIRGKLVERIHKMEIV